MTKDEIKTNLYELIDTFLGGTLKVAQEDREAVVLNHLASDSIQAIEFVLLIESEFEIELNDEDINEAFFTSFDYMAELVFDQLNGSNRRGSDGT